MDGSVIGYTRPLLIGYTRPLLTGWNLVVYESIIHCLSVQRSLSSLVSVFCVMLSQTMLDDTPNPAVNSPPTSPQGKKSNGMFDRRWQQPVLMLCKHNPQGPPSCRCHDEYVDKLAEFHAVCQSLKSRIELLEGRRYFSAPSLFRANLNQYTVLAQGKQSSPLGLVAMSLSRLYQRLPRKTSTWIRFRRNVRLGMSPRQNMAAKSRTTISVTLDRTC